LKKITILNSKGISVLFLIIAMLLMVTIGYVFSYLIPTKEKSVSFVISSSQAFFIAQSGVEYAVRYASDQGWTTPASLLGLNGPGVNQRNLGRGGFTLSYDNTTDKLTSIGVVPNASERRIIVSTFTSFVSKPLILVNPAPCWVNPRTVVRFYIQNVGSAAITLTAFSASWSQPPTRNLTSISMDGAQKFSGTYSSGSGLRNFTPPGNTEVINPNQTVMVNVVWSGNISPNSITTISFYTSTGEQYIFNLDPTGLGLPGC
jgi:hypothetical protein